MSLFDIYSKQKNGYPNSYQYNIVPKKVRTQIYHIWNDFFNQQYFEGQFKSDFYFTINKILCREEGVKSLHFNSMFITDSNPEYQVEHYFDNLQDTDVDKILNVVHVVFTVIELTPDYFKEQTRLHINFNYSATEAIDDLNNRFKENGIGYQYLQRNIVRIDNDLLHDATIKETVYLLSNTDFANANQEFLCALEHFRHKRNQECLNECLKSFETTMKIICHHNHWEFANTDTAKNLINVLLKNNFLHNYHESQLNAMKQLLESQIPTIRNKNSAHGQGIEKRLVPDSLATLMLYVTGATIRFFVQTQNDSVAQLPK